MRLQAGEPPGTGLIVALDGTDLERAESVAAGLSSGDVAFKVGLSLFAARGPEAVRRIARHGRVFLDLKLHDIPHQVGLACSALVDLPVWMLSVHSSGGTAMIRSAADALGRLPESPVLAAVTVLTSLSHADLKELGQGSSEQDQVARLSTVATRAGARAVICSPQEIVLLRRILDPDVMLVCPGVRPGGSRPDDQARTLSPADAARQGADYIVVGRPITGAADPAAAALAILRDLGEAKRGPSRLGSGDRTGVDVR